MLKKFTIKSVLISISFILVAASIVFILQVKNRFDHIEYTMHELAEQEHAVVALKNTRFHVIQVQQFLTDVGATRKEAGFSEAQENKEKALHYLDELAVIKPNLLSVTNTLKDKISAMHKSGVTMAWEYIKYGVEAGNVIMVAPTTGLDDTADILAKQLDELSGSLGAELKRSDDILAATVISSRNIVMFFAMTLLVFVIVCLALIYNKVETPLNALKKSLQAMNNGGGDLTQRISLDSSDEVGEITALFNDFISIIQSLMLQVSRETDSLVASSSRLQGLADAAKQDTAKQQASTDQVATTVTQLTVTVQEVATNTQSASNTAMSSSTEAENGKSVVANTVQSIHALSAGIDTASHVIEKVEADCKNVSSVLDVIQGIADQTNLLALNAAIEAARAGEQGRGFAVVADEVRTLASRTQDSTQEIQTMIEQLLAGSRDAVQVMNNSQNQSKETVSIIEEAGHVLDKISGMATNISGMNIQISNSVSEQQAVVDHINNNIISISDISRTISEDTGKTLEEAENLQRISTHLQAATSQFRV